jgi:hypothetical protein
MHLQETEPWGRQARSNAQVEEQRTSSKSTDLRRDIEACMIFRTTAFQVQLPETATIFKHKQTMLPSAQVDFSLHLHFIQTGSQLRN